MRPSHPDLDAQIADWTGYVRRRPAVAGHDIDELEAHLRDQVDDLRTAGLSDDEAFLVAIKRIGSIDQVSREYAREHSDRLWKQLVADGSASTAQRSRTLAVVAGIAAAAAIAIKVPALWELPPGFYALNAGLLVLPFLAAYVAWSRRPARSTAIIAAVIFAVTAVVLNVYPFAAEGMTMVLAAGHSLVVLWLSVGLVYVGALWRSDTARMDFVRFTGEWFVYVVLIALGGAVLVGLTTAVFAAVGVDASIVVSEWVVPCGAAGAVVVAAALVDAKQSVIENIAPVLTRLFTPLFTAMLLALIVAAIVQWNLVDDDDRAGEVTFLGSRDLLIIFDVVLVVVLALLVYSLSARDPLRPPGWFERLQLLMVTSAIVVDALVLIAMLARIGAFGFSANKLASLGLNLLVLVNLAWSAWLLLGILRLRVPPARLERWQTRYLPVYLAWAAIVVVVFPPVFGFV